MNGIMSNEQKFTATATFRDQRGTTLRIDGIPSWTVSDPTLVTLEPSVDGLTCVVRSRGSSGKGKLTCVASVHWASGPMTVTATTEFEVKDIGLIVGEISFSTPVQR